MRRLVAWLLYAAMMIGLSLTLLWYRGVFLPSGQSRSDALALPGHNLTLTLQKNRFSVEEKGVQLWQSDTGLHVQDFLTCDLDRDGETELLLLTWRRGNYGPSKPFWVSRNDTGWSQHIFIYNWQNGTPVPQWMSSRLLPEVARWALHDKDQLFIVTPDGTETLWQWGYWGLERIA